MPFLISVKPTVLPVIHVRPAIFFIICVVLPTLIVLTLILVEKVRGEWFLIPHASYLLLSDVPFIDITWPVAWIGLLLFLAAGVVGFSLILATGVVSFFLVLATVVRRTCHVNFE
jgi:hypothetical protein